MVPEIKNRIISVFGAQLGEIAWYGLVYDPGIDEVVRKQFEEVCGVFHKYFKGDKHKARILEVGAYRHYTTHLLANKFNCQVVATDISDKSLDAGLSLARSKGVNKQARLVACDFHDLPFSSNYFDFVYIYSAIHHTWRTPVVLNELRRVLKPGGILFIGNEPVRRDFCFYQFRSNRPAEFTDWEKKLEKTDLMNTISSPFLGSRDEEIFGMIENDRIPWTVYEDFFQGEELLEISLTPVEGKFEHWMLSSKANPQSIAEEINRRLAPLRAIDDPIANIFGWTLPESRNICRLSEETADLIQKAQLEFDSNQVMARSQLFGAALKVVIRKQSGTTIQDNMWNRLPNQRGNVFIERPNLPDLSIETDAILMPAISIENSINLKKIFPESHWSLFQETIKAWSMLNKSSCCDINLPERTKDGLLLLRFYAVARPDRPYRISLEIDSADTDHIDIGRSESRLFQAYVPYTSKYARVCISEIDGQLLDLPNHCRVGVCVIVPFSFKDS